MGALQPTFSVLIPCYQRAHLLPEALDSALVQADDGVEVIVVNDGSTDETHAVATAYVRRHPRCVRLLEQENRGVTLARAAGFAVASGDFLVFLDSDDRLEPGMIAACRAAIRAQPQADLVVGNAWVVGPDGRDIQRAVDQAHVPRWPAVLERNPFGASVGVVPRAKSVWRVGGLAIADLPVCEDFDLWVRMIRCGMTVVPVGARLGRIRMTPGSLSRDPLVMLDARIKVLDTCTGSDPRLTCTGVAPAPPIDAPAYARLRNGCVFNALGLALTLERPADIAAILTHLVGGRIDPAYCAAEFRDGVGHGRAALDRRRRRRPRRLPRREIDAALRGAGLPPLGMRRAVELYWVLNPHRDPRALWGTLGWRIGRLVRRPQE